MLSPSHMARRLQARLDRMPEERYKYVALGTVSIATFVATMDASIVNISFPRLTEVFDVPPSTILWVSLVFMLVTTGLMLTLGRVGDVYGRKRVFVAGMVIITIGLLLCALAQNVWELVLFRVVQAVGAAMTLATGNAIITSIFPASERGKAMGMVGAAVSAGFITGPTVGGIMVDSLGWQSIFWTRAPVAALGTLAALILLREQRREAALGFDLPGSAVVFAMLGALLIAVNRGEEAGWSSPLILSLFAGSAVLAVVFVARERRALDPVLDLTVFRDRLFSAGNLSLIIMFIGISSYSFLFPFYLVQGTGRSTSHAGYIMVIVSVTTLLVGPVSGWLSDRIGYRLLTSLGLAIISLSLYWIAQLGADASLGALFPRLVLLGVGSGLFASPNISSIMGSVRRDKLGTASAMIATNRNVGQSIGLAMAGAVFTARQEVHMAGLGGAPGAARVALVEAFHDAIVVAAVVCAVAILASVIRGGAQAHAQAEAGGREGAPGG